MPLAAFLFLVCLAASLGSSFVLARALDRIGVRLRLTDAVIGMLTALGADAPEISTAAAAVLSKHDEIGVGVVLGSNVVNLAALLGIGALLAGRVHLGRRAAALEGATAIAVAAVAVPVAAGWIGPIPALVLCACVLVPYVWLAAQRPADITHGQRVTGLRRRIARAVAEEQRAARSDHHERPATRGDLLVVAPAVALVIGASVGMVHAAVDIGHHFSISGAVMGTLVLAGLTSIPNAVAAVRLALHHRSSAVVSEAFNSNNLNIVAGLLLPAALLGGVAGSAAGRLSAVWALAMTMAVVAMLLRRRGMRRPEAVLVIASYLAFAAVLIHVG